MKSSLLLGMNVIACLIVSTALADVPNEESNAETIPLDQIWGYNLPGTRDIAGIPLPETDPQQGVIGRTDAMFRRQREHDIEQWRRALTAKPPTERAPPGFVLPRQPDFFTLQKASNRVAGMMRQGYEQRAIERESFRAGDEMTLVIFTHPASYYVRLRKVERQANEITVYYQFEPHFKPVATVHFALIPLGELLAGEYRVTYKQIPMDEKYREAGFEPVDSTASTIVCRPFSFTIWEPTSTNEALSRVEVLVPLNQIWAHKMPGTRPVGELDASKTLTGTTEHPIVNEITQRLRRRPKEGEKAGPTFIVAGTGKEALTNAHSVLLGNTTAAKAFSTEADVSLVFYSYSGGGYLRIDSVETAERVITINYRFVTHFTAESTVHFALIPLGKLPEGKYRVNIEQQQRIDTDGRPVTPIPDPWRIVSGNFSFRIPKEGL